MKITNQLLRAKPFIYKIAFYLMVLSLLLVGCYKGIGEDGGKDAQWFPAKLFSDNIDFYHFYLENFNDWFMRSVPNYYFQLYYLLYPFSSVSWDTFKIIWFLINAAFLLLFVLQVKKNFNFSYKKMVIIFLPFVLGFPLLSVFTNGQSTLLILIFIYFSWKFRDNQFLLPIFLSLLTIKYSFGIPIIFGFLLMGYYRSVLLSGILTLVFPLIYSIQFNLKFLPTIFLPLKVATSSSSNPIGSGPGDIMSLYGLLTDKPLLGINILTIGLTIFIILFAFLSFKYHVDKKSIFTCSLLFSLFGFFHFGQAYVLFLLIIPLLYYTKYFKFLYGYLLLFCTSPRIVRILNLLFNQEIDVKEFMRDKYFVIFNIIILLSFFVLVLLDGILKREKSRINSAHSIKSLLNIS